ncbi:MAG: hypothetical protein ABRQ25_14830 [Clostridiaceae bacterium]
MGSNTTIKRLFNPVIFNAVREELKLLYVAVSEANEENGIDLFHKVFSIDKFNEVVVDNLNVLNNFFNANIEMNKDQKERRIEYILACSLEKNETNFILDIEIVKGRDEKFKKHEGDIGFLYKSKNLESKFLPTELKLAEQVLNNSENIIFARDQALKLAWDLHGAYSNYEITYE